MKKRAKPIIIAAIILILAIAAVHIKTSYDNAVKSFIAAIENADSNAVKALCTAAESIYEDNERIYYISPFNESADEHAIIRIKDRSYSFNRISGHAITGISKVLTHIVIDQVSPNGRTPIYYNIEMKYSPFRWQIIYMEVDV